MICLDCSNEESLEYVKNLKKEDINVKEDEAIWKQTNKRKPSFNPLSFGKGNNKTTNILKNRKVGGGS